MKCPKCKNKDTKVLDSRVTKGGKAIRRRRECEKCRFRFTTLEEMRILDLSVEKRNGRVMPFSEEKLERGIRKAFNKRTINPEKIDAILQRVLEEIIKLDKNPIKTARIGRIVLKVLKEMDEAAYICFSAMFGDFDTAEDFNKLLKQFEDDKE